jgi:hypothetical protein
MSSDDPGFIKQRELYNNVAWHLMEIYCINTRNWHLMALTVLTSHLVNKIPMDIGMNIRLFMP